MQALALLGHLAGDALRRVQEFTEQLESRRTGDALELDIAVNTSAAMQVCQEIGGACFDAGARALGLGIVRVNVAFIASYAQRAAS